MCCVREAFALFLPRTPPVKPYTSRRKGPPNEGSQPSCRRELASHASSQLTNRRRATNKPTRDTNSIRCHGILVSVNRHGPGAKEQGIPKRLERKQSFVKKRTKVCPQPRRSSVYHRRKELVSHPELFSNIPAILVVSLQSRYPCNRDFGYDKKSRERRKEGKLCHGPIC